MLDVIHVIQHYRYTNEVAFVIAYTSEGCKKNQARSGS